MKRNLHLLLSFCLIAVALTACKKSGSDPAPDSSSASGDYQPVTTGSTWKYALSYPTADTSVFTMSSATQTLGGKLYHAFQAKAKIGGTSTGYYYHDKNQYILRSTTAGYGDMYYTYLNDTAKVNTSWKSPVTDNGTFNGIPAQMIGTIVAKGSSKTIVGKLYKDVVHTIVELQYGYGGVYTTYATYDYYIAKGIGIIEIDASTLGVTSTTKLVSYQIK